MYSYVRKLLGPLTMAVAMIAAVPAAMSQERDILKEVVDRGTVRIAIQGGQPPYSVIKPDGTPEGYEIDMGNMIAEELGVDVEWVIIDAAGRVTALQTGKADITIANFTANFVRSKVISFTDPYMVVGMVFFTLADRDDIQSVDDLNTADMKVGFGRGSTQETLVPAAAPETTIVRFAGMADTMEALDSGRIDASALDNIGTSGILAESPGKYKVLEGRFSREDISLGLPKGDFEWWRLLNIWIRDFNLSGKNDALYAKWFKSDRPKIFAAW
ncbi:MAG: transporter substrate-binding domain-containing protein [Hyphomicrobiales bacterium]|nr:transporter substrate-binding domain-containing protein [Hyphomicrobiales bacterium]